jgi:LCP family protein required for cell wall assembly
MWPRRHVGAIARGSGVFAPDPSILADMPSPASPPRSPGVSRRPPGRPGPPTRRRSPSPPADQRLLARRAVSLVLLTVVLPGSGHLAVGSRRVGRLALRAWLVGAGALLLALAGWFVARDLLLAVLTRPLVLSLLALLLLSLAVAWPALVIDAWRLGQAGLVASRDRRRVALVTASAVLVTSLPLFAVGTRVWAAGDLIGTVFTSGPPSPTVGGRYNVVLLGGDAGPDRVGLRPDSITLASIDADSGRTVLFSLPRTLEDIPFAPGSAAARALPQGWSCGDACLLNAVYGWGTGHRALFPDAADAGAEAMKQAVSGITGLHVNYYVIVDLGGFRALIDAMGGVELTVGSRVPIGGGTSRVSGYIKPGRQQLDGYHALWYARSRHGASDYERMARQRCVMTAMVNQLDPTTLLARFQDVAAAGKDVVSTDIPGSQLPAFLELGSRAKSQRITSIQFVPPLITPARPDYGVIRSTIRAALDASRHEEAQGDSPLAAPTSSRGSTGAGSAQRPATGGTGSSAPSASSVPPTPSAGSTGSAAGVDVRQICRAG